MIKELILFLPEVYLILAATGLILGEVGYHGERVRIILPTALISVFGSLVQLLFNYTAGPGRFGHANFINDGFSLFLKTLLLLTALIGLLADRKSQEVSLENRTEHAALILGITALGMLVVSSANWIWIIFLMFSLNVLGSLLLSLKKTDRKAIEASFKGNISAIYSLILTSLAVILFYSVTHEFDLYKIHTAIIEKGISSRIYSVGFSLILIGLGFFGTYFPSQLWAKDSYEGASLPATAFASCLFRITTFGILVRVVVVQFSRESQNPGFWIPINTLNWLPVLSVICGLTLLLSALYVFRQTATRKIFAGVLVLQSGFYLLGLLALDQIGFASILLGLATEIFMIGGLFATLSFFEDRRQKSDDEISLSRSVPEGIALLFFLLCVIGLPPLPGFISKFTLISSAARHQWNGLALVALISFVLVGISAFRWVYPWVYGLRQRQMAFSISWTHRVLLLGLIFPLALFSVFAEPMLNWVSSSVAFPLW